MVILTMRPANARARFEFQAGQYAAIGFRRFGRRSPMRCFSLINAPNAAGELQIAFREQGDYTRALAGVQAGDELYVGGPYGSFTVPAGQRQPLVYLAAGIGITPFMSLLRAQIRSGSQVPVTLLYSVRILDDVPFASELLQMTKDCPWLTLRFLVERTFSPHPNVIPGRLTSEVVAEFCDQNADYYVCGPPGYNKQAVELLHEHGIISSQINTEAFGQGSRLQIAGFAAQNLVYSLTAAALMATVGGVFLLSNLRHKTQAATTTTKPAQQTTQSTDTNSTPTPSTTMNPDTGGTYTSPSPNYTYYQPPMSSVS